MVFDLDETLIVANTMRSFENRIEALDRKIRGLENDPQRRAGMAAEMKRYQEDRSILKQYVDSDQVFENGILVKAQGEVVPPLAEGALPLVRPIIRLPERNMVLTRINPAVSISKTRSYDISSLNRLSVEVLVDVINLRNTSSKEIIRLW